MKRRRKACGPQLPVGSLSVPLPACLPWPLVSSPHGPPSSLLVGAAHASCSFGPPFSFFALMRAFLVDAFLAVPRLLLRTLAPCRGCTIPFMSATHLGPFLTSPAQCDANARAFVAPHYFCWPGATLHLSASAGPLLIHSFRAVTRNVLPCCCAPCAAPLYFIFARAHVLLRHPIACCASALYGVALLVLPPAHGLPAHSSLAAISVCDHDPLKHTHMEQSNSGGQVDCSGQ